MSQCEEHHWHKDYLSRGSTITDGVEFAPVICCHCGSTQYARLVRPSGYVCGLRANGPLARVEAFVPEPPQESQKKRRRARS